MIAELGQVSMHRSLQLLHEVTASEWVPAFAGTTEEGSGNDRKRALIRHSRVGGSPSVAISPRNRLGL
jgi:hypothetical protein